MVNPTRTHDRVRLTKRTVDAAKPADREYIVWDTDIAGFGLRVMPGGRKTYLLKYRVGGGRGGQPRKPALGVHGKITAEEARGLAKDWLADIAKGSDPAATRKTQREAIKYFIRNRPFLRQSCEGKAAGSMTDESGGEAKHRAISRGFRISSDVANRLPT